ncbi:hypothetical protein BBK36DRAFT_1161839 [Trichoderma citrinoviride]|uniref:Uncharacterized protein n=1 Tax=Trichoderma citrinoviride TaxID=58853 RepID=A0A2T4B3J3_9HYPO|nr:hypothetical protein BBK36DRAFT_1161839 [Trichoderma citrinoviride]PTB63897.1 hypothetical protein BBK36DRAFT_1161839 [Trichoderma citrinoviride]
MPLGNFATILPFLSPSSTPFRAPVPSSPPSKKEKKEKKKPTLRICFPLKIQRGASSWWEYEEFRIQFRDRLMWRQAFGLDARDPHDTMSFYSSSSSSSCYSGFEGRSGEDEVGRLRLLAGANCGTFYDDVDSDVGDDVVEEEEEEEEEEEDRGMKSRWSFSSSSVHTERADARASFASQAVSAMSSNRLMYLIPRLLFLTKRNDSSTTASSSSMHSPSTEEQKLRPAPLKLKSKRQSLAESAGDKAAIRPPPPPPPPFGTPSSSAALTPEAAEIQHHRNMTLQKLEGSYLYKTKERYLSTFRSIFRTTPNNPPTPKATPPTLPPLRPNSSSPQADPGTYRTSSREWANLRDDIVCGLSADDEALFPFFTDDQKATFMRVKQEEGKFKVGHGSLRDGGGGGGGRVKEALERIEERNWEDVLFVEFEDTPRAMRWWYTTREPQVFEWGVHMI